MVGRERLKGYFSHRVQLVSELFFKAWRVELLSPTIVHKIIALTIGIRGQQDRSSWGEDKKGRFTVKSGYHLARKRVLDVDSTDF